MLNTSISARDPFRTLYCGYKAPQIKADGAVWAYLSWALSIGSFRIRLPVAAKIALATAGITADVPGSPTPPGGSVLLTRTHVPYCNSRSVMSLADPDCDENFSAFNVGSLGEAGVRLSILTVR